MRQIRPDIIYYALTLRSRHGKMERSIQTHFAGFPEGVGPDEGVELRRASPVDPDEMSKMWEDVGHDWMVVNDAEEYDEFIRRGGEALVAEDIARERFGDLVEPHLCVSAGVGGFIRLRPDAPDATVRSRKQQKRRIRERDGHKCQLCGATPEDDPRVRLEVHHVRPFSKGGPTVDPNLITLCHECHQAIGDSFEPDLYWATAGPIASATDPENADNHREAVEQHRRRIERMLRNRQQR